ncbi:MAG: hypothetical protein HC817_15185 [Saprospiraceae bacterium]|nr:hypothetical protein [Saprospiraceae bacterium]
MCGGLWGAVCGSRLLNKAYRQPSVKDIILVYLDNCLWVVYTEGGIWIKP